MKRWAWRIVLPIPLAILSIGQAPLMFGGLLSHGLGLFFVVSCLDMIPFSVFNTIAPYQISHHWFPWWARALFWEIHALVFLFWFWVGWKIDLRLASRDTGPAVEVVEAVVGLGLSLMLFLQRPIPPVAGYAVVYRVVVMVWAVALLAFVILRVARVWAARQGR
jgi:hypothetical protein